MTSSDNDVLVTRQTNVLSAEELADAYKRWEAPRMVSVSDVENNDAMLTVDAIETLQQQAQEEGYKTGYEEGHQTGYEAGLATGKADIQQQVALFSSALSSLDKPLQELDQQIEKDLVRLAMTLAGKIIRRELKTDPEHVIGAVRAALEVLPVNDRKLRVYAHPQDIPIIKKGLALEDNADQWQWIEDPLLTRGGVRVETADTTIDATIESRMKSLINQLLGEDRADDHGE